MTQLIAELCQNHLGDRQILKKMVEEASIAGADFCKIQSMKAASLTVRKKFEEGETDEQGNITTIKRPYDREYERLSPLDLNDDDHKYFIDMCRENSIQPLTTVFTRDRVEFLSRLDWGHKKIKVASFDCRSLPLLKDLVDAGFKHLLISTGSTFDEEIEKTAQFLNQLNCKFTFLHCVSVYPTPLKEGHLDRIDYLRGLTDNVGFSEHSSYENDGLKLTMLSLTKNIQWIERHFTSIDKSLTKDGIVSLDREQLRELADLCKMDNEKLKALVTQKISKDEQKLMLGDKLRDLSEIEILNRDYYHGRFANHRDGKVLYNWEEE